MTPSGDELSGNEQRSRGLRPALGTGAELDSDEGIRDGEDRRCVRARAAGRVGRRAGLRLSGRRDQRHPRRLPRGRRDRVHPGAARGDRGVRGLCARQVHGRGRRLPRDVGARRDPPAQRALRRQARPSAGGRDRRPAGPHVARLGLSAGSRSGLVVQGRRGRVRADLHGARTDAAPDRSRDADRPGDALPDLRHLPQRRAGGRLRGSAARPRRGVLVRGGRQPWAARALRCCAARRGRGAQRGRARGDPRRPGRQGRGRGGPGGGGRARRRRRQGAQRPCGARRRPPVRDRCHRPARHQAVRRHDGRLRHPAARRHELSLLRVAARARPGSRGRDRHRRPPDRQPVSDGGQPGRRRGRHAAGVAAAT